MASVYKSEHRTRYHKEPHIRVLNWDKEAIKYFLKEKVLQLDDKYFNGNLDKDGKTIATWLGTPRIYNKARDITENIVDYLLRHTRLLPRDIVILGNALCRDIERAKSLSSSFALEKVIRTTTSDMARFFGNEQLKICGNQIASNSMPPHAARHGYSGVYTGNQEYIGTFTDDLKLLIKCIGKDKFDSSELSTAYAFSQELLGHETDAFSVLWQNGLIGYHTVQDCEDRLIFYSESKMDEFKLPLDQDQYVFHSCLIDSLGLVPVGKQPTY